jgi:hypothetical protein
MREAIEVNKAMTVMQMLQGKLIPGLKLATPIQGKPFLVESVSHSKVILLRVKGGELRFQLSVGKGYPFSYVAEIG